MTYLEELHQKKINLLKELKEVEHEISETTRLAPYLYSNESPAQGLVAALLADVDKVEKELVK